MTTYHVYGSITGFLGGEWLAASKTVTQEQLDERTYTLATVNCPNDTYLIFEASDADGPCTTYALTVQEIYQLLETLRNEGRIVLTPPPPWPGARVVNGQWV